MTCRKLAPDRALGATRYHITAGKRSFPPATYIGLRWYRDTCSPSHCVYYYLSSESCSLQAERVTLFAGKCNKCSLRKVLFQQLHGVRHSLAKKKERKKSVENAVDVGSPAFGECCPKSRLSSWPLIRLELGSVRMQEVHRYSHWQLL